MVFLGFGKYARADRIYALDPTGTTASGLCPTWTLHVVRLADGREATFRPPAASVPGRPPVFVQLEPPGLPTPTTCGDRSRAASLRPLRHHPVPTLLSPRRPAQAPLASPRARGPDRPRGDGAGAQARPRRPAPPRRARPLAAPRVAAVPAPLGRAAVSVRRHRDRVRPGP